MTSSSKELKAFEFFSGIGGMRCACDWAAEKLDIKVSVLEAWDMNSSANQVYEHNFKHKPSFKSIEHITAKEVDGKADIWLMSPPCQPYTKGGLRLDEKDGRANGLHHLMCLWEAITSPPTFVFLENVRGFEVSQSHKKLIDVLKTKGYNFEEFILSPTQFGIPNSRVRYYLLGQLPSSTAGVKRVREPEGEQSQISFSPPANCERVSHLRLLKEYEEKNLSKKDLETLFIPASKISNLIKKKFKIDTATQHSHVTTTITKHYVEVPGSGPLVLCNETGDMSLVSPSQLSRAFEEKREPAKETANEKEDRENEKEILTEFPCEGCDCIESGENLTQYLGSTRLHIDETGQNCASRFQVAKEGSLYRYLSTQEILTLSGFPSSFSFPESYSFKAKTRLLGNSINVRVVAILLHSALSKFIKN